MHYYSSITNKDKLEDTSSFWTNHYNFLLNMKSYEDWEKTSIYDAILSEKVFDI